MIALFTLFVMTAFAQSAPATPATTTVVVPQFDAAVQPKDPVAAVRKTADDARAKIKALTGRVIALEAQAKGLPNSDALNDEIEALKKRLEIIEKKSEAPIAAVVDSGRGDIDLGPITKRLDALEADTDDVEGDLETRLRELEAKSITLSTGPVFDITWAPSVYNVSGKEIVAPVGLAFGPMVDLCSEDGKQGFCITYAGSLTDGDGYRHAVSYTRFKKNGPFAWGYSGGMSAAFYGARDGLKFKPFYDAWRGGVSGGLYLRLTLAEGEKGATDFTIRPRVEWGTVAWPEGSATEGRLGLEIGLSRRTRVGGTKVADPYLQEELDALDKKVEALGKKRQGDDVDAEDIDLDEEP